MKEHDRNTIANAADVLQAAMEALAELSSDGHVQILVQGAGQVSGEALLAVDRLNAGPAATIGAQLERIIELLDSMATDLSIATESTQVRLMELEAQQRAARVRELNQLITPGGKAP